jgi:hypothetical protein
MTIASDYLELTKVNGFSRLEPISACDEPCETLWDRVLRICDQWLPQKYPGTAVLREFA